MNKMIHLPGFSKYGNTVENYGYGNGYNRFFFGNGSNSSNGYGNGYQIKFCFRNNSGFKYSIFVQEGDGE